MANVKYRFNPEPLNYYKVESTFGQKFKRFLTYFAASIFAAIIYYIVFASFFDLPKEKGLKRQISELDANYHVFSQQLSRVETVIEDMQDRDDNIYRTIFEAEPINKSVRDAGFGGSDRYKEYDNMSNGEIVGQTARRLDQIMAKVVIQSRSYDELIEYAKNYSSEIASIPAIQPISNKDLTRTASGWGWRIHPIYKIRKFHYGIDFTSPTGSEIYATGDGIVEEMTSSRRGYGNKIVLNHGFGYKTLYAHMSGFNVKQGQKVKRGDVIGFVGNTGLSTAPHLHYEVIHNNKAVNPINYFFNDLTAEEYDRMIEISMKSGQTFD
ncbi:MAG: M23 family metallopeptidase [Bacteroidales bacterium]|nr:M23 family metallopeptidase [Bacteroidales bacterium]